MNKALKCNKKSTYTLPVFSIQRHRMTVDGIGVTTLVAGNGCPLKCKYCINKEGLSTASYDEGAKWRIRNLTSEELYEKLKIDDLYFRATDGGVCFGGGESLVHADFIKEFSEFIDGRWKIIVETSLNVPVESLKKVIPFVDEYIVDIKDMNPEIYKAYTGSDNERVINNLKILSDYINDKQIRIRVPRIPEFNKQSNIDFSVSELKKIGFNDFDIFDYVLK